MTKLDQYLDEVCRGVGGPRALRLHLRQELREHLLDAAAEHRAAGMTDEQAVDRAIEDFGGPAQLRSELEATHGHRAMAVVIDKALQWKERTMKAKWLWVTFAHLALVLLIAAEVAFIWAVLIFIVPRFKETLHHGLMDAAEPVVQWSTGILNGVITACMYHWWFWAPLIVAWALFEWRVRSENKTSMRLAALGTIALGLMCVVMLTAAALVLPMNLAMPGLNARHPEPIVRDSIAGIDAAVANLKRAAASQDWTVMAEEAGEASILLGRLSRMGAAAPTLAAGSDQANLDAIRGRIRSAEESMRVACQAAREKNADRFRSALTDADRSLAEMRDSTTRPAR